MCFHCFKCFRSVSLQRRRSSERNNTLRNILKKCSVNSRFSPSSFPAFRLILICVVSIVAHLLYSACSENPDPHLVLLSALTQFQLFTVSVYQCVKAFLNMLTWTSPTIPGCRKILRLSGEHSSWWEVLLSWWLKVFSESLCCDYESKIPIWMSSIFLNELCTNKCVIF